MPKVLGKLPPDAEGWLKAAAQSGLPGSLNRRIAIDRAYDRIAETYPELMKRETRMLLNVNNVRAAFLNIWEAKVPQGGGDPSYNGKFILPPNHNQIAQLDDAMRAVAREKWGAKGDAIFDKLVKTGKPKNIEVAFVHDDYTDGDGNAYDGFEGMFYLSAKSPADKRPLILDRDRTPLIAADGRPYSGCYVNVRVELWAQDNKFGKGIRAELKGVQFVRDGDSFGGGVPASADDFEDVTDGADAGDLA